MSKLNIILDLDQTIISAEAVEDYDFKKYKEKAKKFTYKDMDGYYIVFERPGLQKFLTFLFKNFNVSVWTAASKDYALFIVEKIIIADKKNRKLDWIFFSYQCDISKNIKGGSKDLSLLFEDFELEGYNKDNTVIIDDYDEVYKTQPDNCIIAVPFEFTDDNSENDNFLKKLQPALEKLKTSSDGSLATNINKTMNIS